MAIFENYYGDNIPYFIGEKYQYPDGDVMVLKAIDENRHRFLFNKNHWCTDLVFKDLIRVKTGVPVYKSTTRQLFIFPW